MDEIRRASLATTVFASWVVIGLFIDGWAHNAGKPEDFWTPWHAVLYSGFAVGAVWYVVGRRRVGRQGGTPVTDRLTVAGFVMFGAAGVGDAIWHTALGVEEDVAALLSPTHLALMIGGLLLIGGPLRARRLTRPAPATWREALPDVVAIALALAVVGFFLQFLSPFHGIHGDRYGPAGSETAHLLGVASVLLTNVLLLAGVGWAWSRRARLPAGALTAILTTTTLLLSSLTAFESLPLTAAALAAGVTADVVVRRGRSRRTLLLASPAVLWVAWFAIYHARWGLGWPAEFWTGAVVLAVLTGWGIDLLLDAGAAATAHDEVELRQHEPALG